MNDKIKNLENIRERVRISEEILYKNGLDGKIDFGLMLNDIKYLLNENDNLSRKLQEKIEELKEKNKPQPDCAEPVERTEEMVNMRWVNYNYISKDKIKAKIEEINEKLEYCWESEYEYCKEVLQSLLEKE